MSFVCGQLQRSTKSTVLDTYLGALACSNIVSPFTNCCYSLHTPVSKLVLIMFIIVTVKDKNYLRKNMSEKWIDSFHVTAKFKNLLRNLYKKIQGIYTTHH